METNNTTKTEQTHTFATRTDAWQFMRDCDEAGIMVGYPSLSAPYTVRTVRTIKAVR